MLSIVIPAYNEENRITKTLTNYISFLRKMSFPFEIIVVMDGCSDNTPKIVKDFARINKEVKYLIFNKRLGKGRAIMRGFNAAKGDVIAFVDADNSISPKEFLKLLDAIESGYDIAIASRRAIGAKAIKWNLKRKILSRCFNIIVKILFLLPFENTQCGAKVFKKNTLKNLQINTNGFAFDVELLYKLMKKGCKIKEIGVLWVGSSESKVKLKSVFEILFDILKLRLVSFYEIIFSQTKSYIRGAITWWYL